LSGSRNDAWRAGRGADRIVLGVGLRAGQLWERKGQGRRRESFLAGAPQPARDGDDVDVAALAAENAQLRELVIALSRLAIKIAPT
jgi:hypothetical protein